MSGRIRLYFGNGAPSETALSRSVVTLYVRTWPVGVTGSDRKRRRLLGNQMSLRILEPRPGTGVPQLSRKHAVLPQRLRGVSMHVGDAAILEFGE